MVVYKDARSRVPIFMVNSREVLEEDPCWRKRHLGFILLLLPVQNVLDIFLLGVKAIAVTNGCFQ